MWLRGCARTALHLASTAPMPIPVLPAWMTLFCWLAVHSALWVTPVPRASTSSLEPDYAMVSALRVCTTAMTAPATTQAATPSTTSTTEQICSAIPDAPKATSQTPASTACNVAMEGTAMMDCSIPSPPPSRGKNYSCTCCLLKTLSMPQGLRSLTLVWTPIYSTKSTCTRNSVGGC